MIQTSYPMWHRHKEFFIHRSQLQPEGQEACSIEASPVLGLLTDSVRDLFAGVFHFTEQPCDSIDIIALFEQDGYALSIRNCDWSVAIAIQSRYTEKCVMADFYAGEVAHILCHLFSEVTVCCSKDRFLQMHNPKRIDREARRNRNRLNKELGKCS